MKIHVFNPNFTLCWLARLSVTQARRLDNGHLISIGLVIGEDITPGTLARWVKKGIASPCEVPAPRAW
jgi:hypothetical protein